MSFFLEAVTTCVGYDDFLTVTASWNSPHLDRWVIVTRPEDENTREVCRKHNLECLLVEDGGAEFTKGRLVERGLRHTAAEGWRLHLDADIVIPGAFRQLLEAAELQEDKIYGCDRIMISGWNEWVKFRNGGWLQRGHHDYHCRVNFPEYPVGTRWVSQPTGYAPIGFFQLWHSTGDLWRGIRSRPYPERHNDACRTDVQFSLLWDRPKRELLPEIIVAHLESEPGKNGANWNGRTTRRFGPEVPQPPIDKPT